MSSGVTQRAQLRTRPRGDRKGWIDVWDPENPEFWQTTGRHVARRNLVFSILAEHLGFSVWVLWSIVAVNLNSVGFAFRGNVKELPPHDIKELPPHEMKELPPHE